MNSIMVDNWFMEEVIADIKNKKLIDLVAMVSY